MSGNLELALGGLRAIPAGELTPDALAVALRALSAELPDVVRADVERFLGQDLFISREPARDWYVLGTLARYLAALGRDQFPPLVSDELGEAFADLSVLAAAAAAAQRPAGLALEQGPGPQLAGDAAARILDGLEAAFASAGENLARAGVPAATFAEVVRVSLGVAGLSTAPKLREAAAWVAERERDELLRKAFGEHPDAEALERARRAFARLDVAPHELGRLLRLSLLVAARAADTALQEAVVVEHALASGAEAGGKRT